jgi:choline kinase
MPVRDAIVLAAGVGIRLRSVVDDRPKGLIEIGGHTLVGRSIGLLRAAGVERITIVAGYRAELYRALASGLDGVSVVLNPAFETTGSMASLDVGIRDHPRDVVVLESDIVYDARALEILTVPAVDATVISGPTGAGDEVWVCAPERRVVAMSKARNELPSIAGEFVGITRISAETCVAMHDAFRTFVAQHGHGRMDYETGALVQAAASRVITAHLVADLQWGEIDDERQYTRVTSLVWPAVTARDRVQ